MDVGVIMMCKVSVCNIVIVIVTVIIIDVNVIMMCKVRVAVVHTIRQPIQVVAGL